VECDSNGIFIDINGKGPALPFLTLPRPVNGMA
jgi:hypothetical protein